MPIRERVVEVVDFCFNRAAGGRAAARRERAAADDGGGDIEGNRPREITGDIAELDADVFESGRETQCMVIERHRTAADFNLLDADQPRR